MQIISVTFRLLCLNHSTGLNVTLEAFLNMVVLRINQVSDTNVISNFQAFYASPDRNMRFFLAIH